MCRLVSTTATTYVYVTPTPDFGFGSTPHKRSKYIFRPYFFTGNISFHVLDISKLNKKLVWVSSGGGGVRTVTNSGLWTICVFRVMTFKRPEMTFKASEYFLIMNIDYFVSISFNLLYYTTILPWNTNGLKNPRVFLGSWPLRPRKWPL